jgi:osmotically-inducible protein OsmY
MSSKFAVNRSVVALSAVFIPLSLTLAACSSEPTMYERERVAVLEDRGNVLEDEAISSKVAAALLEEPRLRDSEIHVATFDNIVRLTGTVESNRDAVRAENIATTVRGVRGVDNGLVIR